MEPKIRLKGFCGEWNNLTLSQIATMHARIGWQNLRKDEFLSKGDYYLITGTDFIDGAIDYHTCHYVEEDRYNQDKNIQLKEGSILITKDGTLGKVAYVDNLDKPATLNAGVFNVVCKGNDIDSRFLFQYLKSPRLMDYVNSTATGGTIKHLNQNILVNFPVCFPEIREQRFIGVYFLHLDSLIQSTTKKIESLKKVKAASLQSMFPQEGENTPRVRFKEFDGEWEIDTLENIARIIKGEQINKNELFDHGTYYVLNGGVEPSGYTENYNTKSDTISISEGGNSCGYVYYNTSNFWSGGHNYTLQNVSINNSFLYAYLKSKEHEIMSKRVGSGLPNIQKKSLQEFSVRFPINSAEQQLLGSFFFSLDSQINLQTQRLEKLKQIKSACLDNMFV